MFEWTPTDEAVLLTYPKAVIHMKRQFLAKRFGLVYGTGLTQDVGIPGWQELNYMVARDTRVNGSKLLHAWEKIELVEFLKTATPEQIDKLFGGGPEETILTQRLFEHFRAKRQSEAKAARPSLALEADIRQEWRNIIRDKLYTRAEKSPAIILEKHKYLRAMLPIIRNTPLTVTYNFDDVIELSLMEQRSAEQKKRDRGYETTNDIRVPSRLLGSVVYHPNGYIPRDVMEDTSEGIVLSEDEFADRMIETMTGQYASLLHHLSRNTCLFVGLSLKDSILKNLLRQCALVTPGHYHYYVSFYREGAKPTKEEQDCIRAAHFETYNLITLFLSGDEIASLAKLIVSGFNEETKGADVNDITHLCKKMGVSEKYCFYVVGAVGAGKSSVVAHLRDLVTQEEWLEKRLDDLAEDWHSLEKDEIEKRKRERIDLWLADQFEQKNNNLWDEKLGLIISDRCPLDPIVFTPKGEWRAKAALLLEKLCPGKTRDPVHPGHVILLENDPEVLELRVRKTPKKYRKAQLEEMQDDLQNVYDMAKGVTRIDTRFMTLGDVMKRVAYVIHIQEPHQDADVHQRLSEIKENGYVAKT